MLVLHHCVHVIIIVWSSRIKECTCMLFTFENGVPLLCYGASVVWHYSLLLMNSFNKTEAAVFLCRLCFQGAFPFISLIQMSGSKLPTKIFVRAQTAPQIILRRDIDLPSTIRTVFISTKMTTMAKNRNFSLIHIYFHSSITLKGVNNINLLLKLNCSFSLLHHLQTSNIKYPEYHL